MPLGRLNRKPRGGSARSVVAGVAVVILTAVQAWGYGEPIPEVIDRIRKGGDPHEGALGMFARKIDVRNAPDSAKADAAGEGVQLAAAILSTRDPEIDISMDRFPGRIPPFDYAKYGMRPFMGVVNPDRIEDPVVREAYREALAKHREYVKLWRAEFDKQQEADYCIGRVQDIMVGATQKEVIAKTVRDSIAELQDADWIKDYLRAKLLPPSEDAAPATQPRAPEPAPVSSAAAPESTRPAVEPPPDQPTPPVVPTDQPAATLASGETPPSSPELRSDGRPWLPWALGCAALLAVIVLLVRRRR